jgi:hypothetical protein
MMLSFRWRFRAGGQNRGPDPWNPDAEVPSDEDRRSILDDNLQGVGLRTEPPVAYWWHSMSDHAVIETMAAGMEPRQVHTVDCQSVVVSAAW